MTQAAPTGPRSLASILHDLALASEADGAFLRVGDETWTTGVALGSAEREVLVAGIHRESPRGMFEIDPRLAGADPDAMVQLPASVIGAGRARVVALAIFHVRAEGARGAFAPWSHTLVKSALTTVTDVLLREACTRLEDRAAPDSDTPWGILAEVAHEMNNPLAALAGVAGLLRSGDRPTGSVETASALERNITSLQRLVADLALASQLGRGVAPGLRKREVDAADEVALARWSVDAGMRASGVRLELDCESVRVRLDRDRLQQALGNVLVNATRYARPGGRVCIGCRPSQGGVLFFVEDDGPGLSPEERTAVFERYVRGRAAAGTQGQGIGLYVVRKIAELHGGSASAVEPTGDGARFELWFPGE